MLRITVPTFLKTFFTIPHIHHRWALTWCHFNFLVFHHIWQLLDGQAFAGLITLNPEMTRLLINTAGHAIGVLLWGDNFTLLGDRLLLWQRGKHICLSVASVTATRMLDNSRSKWLNISIYLICVFRMPHLPKHHFALVPRKITCMWNPYFLQFVHGSLLNFDSCSEWLLE